jgi:hypothetical protein
MEAVGERNGKSLSSDLPFPVAQAERDVARGFEWPHQKISRPVARDGESYLASMACGAHR